MSEYIPLEIQAEILKRLPLEPLLRCRTVSKSFKSLIDSQDFIVSYCVDHPQIDYRYILRYQIPYEPRLNDDPVDDKYLTCFDNDDDDYMYSEPGFSHHDFFIHPIPSLIKKIEPHSKAVGSSHGLLCFSGSYYENPDRFSNETEMVVLWNVSLRKSVGIRVPDICDKPNGNFYDLKVDNVFGFGVCPVTYDPIVINIKCIAYKREKNDIRHISDPWKVRVFTMTTGTWI
uniref:uncharacterized protein LOC122588169 n=1 Tax=Erigeron canadensis TaxID=72917 RepID=UPI001CB9C092|nr:uncharacterized protein LOC122588169 [Erigeron canadensis]